MFHVLLNNMPVIADLDIYSRVGKAVAYDEVVPFSVDRGQLFVSDGSVEFDGTLSIQFMKVSDLTYIMLKLLLFLSAGLSR